MVTPSTDFRQDGAYVDFNGLTNVVALQNNIDRSNTYDPKTESKMNQHMHIHLSLADQASDKTE